MPVFNNIIAGAAGSGGSADFKIERSLRFNSSDDTRLDNSMSTGGNRNKFTFSFWVKFAKSDYAVLSAGTDSSGYFEFKFNSESKLEIHGENITNTQTVAQFRDPAAWYHVMLVIDKSNSTATDRAIIYVNGERQTLSTTSQANTSNVYWGHSSQPHRIGGRTWGGGNEANYYLAEFHHLDGIAATPSDFGETDDNGVWQPKEYGGNYGTIGFHLDFSDNTSTTTIAEDSSGNNNDWTANNLSVASGAGNDSLIDTPTNADANSGNNIGNYPTFNPISQQYSSANHVLTNGNLQVGDSSTSKGNYALEIATMAAPPSGKWYWEMTLDDANSAERRSIGVVAADADFATYLPQDNLDDGFVGIWCETGQKIINGTRTSYGASATDGDIIGVALDQDGNTVTFYKNNSSQGSISLPTNMQGKSILAAVISIQADENVIGNWGQRPFAYTPPTGYKSLCTQNLPDPDIAKGSDYFDAKPYDGTGNTLNVTGLDFEPDLVYTATHNASGYVKYIWDDVRGVTKALATSSSQGDDAEITVSNGLTSFNSDGFTVGNNAQVNENSSRKMIAWCWAGGSAFSNSANTNGATIASSGLANTTSGFSIVSYSGNNTSGATVKHGLNKKVEFAILKTREQTGQYWHVYHSAFADNEYIYLNSASAKTSGSDFMNGTPPSSSVFTLGNGQACNKSADDVIAYCFAPIEGYSSFGKYSGNGSDDGPFVYTGFRPRWIMTKAYSSNSNNNNNWIIIDTARDPINEADKALNPNTNASTLENAHTGIDILSNGFKLKGDTNGQSNYNGWDYIYAAFAEHPFKIARAR